MTATIDSIPLITASIMSKKLAEGANGIVMDIKVGSGAFMSNKTEAKKLARSIINTAKRFDKNAVTLLTNMDQPLGDTVGHTLEIIESIETLKGNGPKDLTEISLALAAHMIHIGGVESSYPKALKAAKAALKSGKALKVFSELIEHQGGNSKVVENYNLMDLSSTTTDVLAPSDGYIKSFHNKDIGFLCTELGGGRKVKSDKIDFGVGFKLHKKIGDKVKKGMPLLTIYHRENQKNKVKEISETFINSVIKLSKQKVKKPETIYDVLSS